MKSIIPLVLLSIITLNVFAQRITISGYITDKESGERLIGASVYDKTSLQGTSANNFGFYSISLPAGKISLMVSFVGYATQTFELSPTSDVVLNVQLELLSKELGEITVVGNKVNKVEETQMSTIDIPIQKLQRIPVIMGEADVLKVIQLLPGVQSGTEGTSGIYVRGGGPDQNLFLLDGVPVYNASHLLGFFSVFNPDAVKTIKLYKGGFPARFGGRLSSVVDISMKDGNMKKIKGDFSIGIISSKLSIEGPIIKDKTSFMLSARRTYLDILSKPLFWYANSQSEGNASGGAYFHDFNLKLNHIFNERSRLYLSGYLGKDKGFGNTTNEYSYLDSDNKPREFKSKTEFGLGWGNNIASIRWNYLLNNRLFSNTTLTYSRYRFEVESDYNYEDVTAKTKTENYFQYYSGIEDWTAKIDFDYFPSPRHDIKFGSSYTNHHFSPGVSHLKLEGVSIDSNEAGIDKTFGNRDIYANELSFFAEDDITLTDNFKINAGLHLSVFMVEDETFVNLQPRLSLLLKATDNCSFKASYSRMAQHVHLLTTSGISMPTDLWLPVTKNFDPPISDQVALGTAINLPEGLEFTMEGFYKTMNNLIEYKEGASFMSSAMNWENKVEKGKGWSYGLEVMLEKTIGKTTGWIAYTWSKTERQFEKLNFGKPFPAKYDRRHDISVVITHEFNKKVDISGTWVYGTGNAVTLAIMDFPQANIPNTQNYWYNNNLKDYGGRNNYRMPAYHRLDLGINLHKVKKHGIRTWSFSVYNAYNRQNPFMLMWETKNAPYIYDPVTGTSTQTNSNQTVLKQFSLFPLIPSISYSFKF
jgi:outer membrane receptor for ferrienterochelin and colicin